MVHALPWTSLLCLQGTAIIRDGPNVLRNPPCLYTDQSPHYTFPQEPQGFFFIKDSYGVAECPVARRPGSYSKVAGIPFVSRMTVVLNPLGQGVQVWQVLGFAYSAFRVKFAAFAVERTSQRLLEEGWLIQVRGTQRWLVYGQFTKPTLSVHSTSSCWTGKERYSKILDSREMAAA